MAENGLRDASLFPTATSSRDKLWPSVNGQLANSSGRSTCRST